MSYTGAGAHILDIAGLDDRAVAHAVLVLQPAFQNVSDDFHIAMRVEWKTGATCDAVVVQDPQGAKLLMSGVVVVGERKCETGMEPAVVCMSAILAFANSNHIEPPVDRQFPRASG